MAGFLPISQRIMQLSSLIRDGIMIFYKHGKTMRLTPKTNTVRQILALSGNQCAFPGCTEKVVNNDGALVSQICHIEAAEVGGERFNENQSDEERRSFENLVILCYRHHVETDDVEKFPVEEMKKIKANHEKLFAQQPFNSTDDTVEQLISNSFSFENTSDGVQVNSMGNSGNQFFNNAGGNQFIVYEEKEEKDFGIIDEIFTYILSQKPPVVEGAQAEIDKAFLVLKEKVELNFDSDVRDAVTETLFNVWGQKELVGKFVGIMGDENPLRIKALIDKIQTDFRKARGSKTNQARVDELAIIEEIALMNLPESKKTNPEYLINAKAVVLYCFEMCHFGIRQS